MCWLMFRGSSCSGYILVLLDVFYFLMLNVAMWLWCDGDVTDRF